MLEYVRSAADRRTKVRSLRHPAPRAQEVTRTQVGSRYFLAHLWALLAASSTLAPPTIVSCYRRWNVTCVERSMQTRQAGCSMTRTGPSSLNIATSPQRALSTVVWSSDCWNWTMIKYSAFLLGQTSTSRFSTNASRWSLRSRPYNERTSSGQGEISAVTR